MKKTIKIISLSLVLIFFCVTLCGCVSLDVIKDTRAEIMSDGVIKLYDGTEYKLLPDCEELSPMFNNFEDIYIVKNDVPLLLTWFYYENSLTKSDDGKFLFYYSEKNLFGDVEPGVNYCRLDVYDEILERINRGFVAEACGYSYYDYKTERKAYYKLTKAQADAVTQVYTSQEPETMTETETINILSNYDYWIELFECSDDMLFKRYTVDAHVINGIYYLVEYDEDWTPTIYKVPKEFYDEFDGIFKKMIEAEEEYWEYM